jgi:putative acetyltransferase
VHSRATDGRRMLAAPDKAGSVLGYIDLEPDGHIDDLWCIPQALGQGVAVALYDVLEDLAATPGLKERRVEASDPARRLFEKKGFSVRRRL